MQIPILSGIYTDNAANFRNAYPVNMVPVPKENGISAGFLRPADGLVEFGTGPGIDRGGINWNGVCYRVMGSKLVSIAADGIVTELGDVGGSGQVTMDYSFDYLGVASSGNLYLWDGATLQQVTDSDLGFVVDFLWVDGYFMSTDGVNLIVTELNNPFAIDPLKYGSSEVDPDPIKSMIKVRNEVHVLNRHTIEVFSNVGGENFPFQRVDGAQIQRGVLGTFCCCLFVESVAFLGSGRNEAPSIWLGANGQSSKISNNEIDLLLQTYSEAELSASVMEARVDKGHQHLMLHLPDRTIVYDAAASQVLGNPVWFTLTSTLSGHAKYKAKNLVWAYDRWLCGDPTSARHGYLTNEISTHYGDDVRWEFGTLIVYNEGRGAVLHELELVCLTGRVAFGLDPAISTSYSVDGVTWSQEKFVKVGMQGDRAKRIVWLQQGHMRNWRIQRFRGDSQAFISAARLEARLEPLAF